MTYNESLSKMPDNNQEEHIRATCGKCQYNLDSDGTCDNCKLHDSLDRKKERFNRFKKYKNLVFSVDTEGNFFKREQK